MAAPTASPAPLRLSCLQIWYTMAFGFAGAGGAEDAVGGVCDKLWQRVTRYCDSLPQPNRVPL